MSALDDARGRVREAGGRELCERLEALDRTSAPQLLREASPDAHVSAPPAGTAFDTDVVIAGGGLWSMLAPLLARRGLRVVVVDRFRACSVHREWNASRRELAALVDAGIVTNDELERLIVARYDVGTCNFHGGASYPVHDVLDCAVDAGPLLAHVRKSAEAAGVTFLDHTRVIAERAGEHGVTTLLHDATGAPYTLVSQFFVDARGTQSPYCDADLVCPTVGGVLTGLREGDEPDAMNPRVGEILATVDDVESGRQHVWEAFPGHPGETTVYLFYYAARREQASLLELYARFFSTLPSYKAGDPKLLRPTFGFIPGWSRLCRGPRAPHPRIALVGDAAARHSPLTYCGFGATLRSLRSAESRITDAIANQRGLSSLVVDDAPIHAFTGALAHMMASRAFRGPELNQLLDAAFSTLHDMGEREYQAMLRDEMSPRSVVTFLKRTSERHPAVWGHVMRGLGFGSTARWSYSLARTLVAGPAA